VKFNHISLVVADPEASAEFYTRYLMPDGASEWLEDSLHLRDSEGVDLAFRKGMPATCAGAHHGFLAVSVDDIEDLLFRLRQDQIEITEECKEENFRSIMFLDLDAYVVEVYWESSWP
jgi:catechol 2,3-dioxygenase-like lactoylglutathione lyase family enzyme